jgi:hypothetical protein
MAELPRQSNRPSADGPILDNGVVCTVGGTQRAVVLNAPAARVHAPWPGEQFPRYPVGSPDVGGARRPKR